MTEADHWLWRNLPFSCSYSLLSSSFVKVRFILSLSQPTKYITIPLFFNRSYWVLLWSNWIHYAMVEDFFNSDGNGGTKNIKCNMALKTLKFDWTKIPCGFVLLFIEDFKELQNRLWMSISFVTVMKFVLIPHFHVEGILSVHWSWIIFFLFCFWFKI